MPGAENSQKTCIVCGQEVAGKPRVKDAKGRYVCAGECQRKLAAAASAPPARATGAGGAGSGGGGGGGDDVMARLIDASPMKQAINCPACSAPMPAGSVVCVRCGHNTQTGKSMRTQVVRVKEEKGTAAAAGGRRAVSSDPGNWGPSLAVWFGGAFALNLASNLLTLVSPLAGAALGVPLAIAGLAAFVYAIVVAFQHDQRGWAWIGILSIVPLVNLLTILPWIVYVLFLCPSRVVRGVSAGLLLGGLVGIGVVIAVAGPEALGTGLTP